MRKIIILSILVALTFLAEWIIEYRKNSLEENNSTGVIIYPDRVEPYTQPAAQTISEQTLEVEKEINDNEKLAEELFEE